MSHGPRWSPSRVATSTVQPKRNRSSVRRPAARLWRMTAIPATFRAYVAEKVGDDARRARRPRVRARRTCRPARSRSGSRWSSVNYKDGLATRADGKVARISPLIPGIDLAGEVVGQRRSAIAGRRRRAGPRLRARRLAPRRVRRVPARAGRLGRAAGARPVAARRDGDRDGRLHGGDVRRRARGTRARARRRAGARDRRLAAASAGRRSRSWPTAATRSGRRPASPTRPPGCGAGRGRDPDAGRGDRRGTAARIGTLGGRGRRGRRGDPAVRAADAADRVARSRRPGTPAARSSRRRSSRSSCAASRCSGWTRSTCRSPARRELWDRLATDLRPRDLGVHCTEVTLDTLDEALDGIVAGDGPRPLDRPDRGVGRARQSSSPRSCCERALDGRRTSSAG